MLKLKKVLCMLIALSMLLVLSLTGCGTQQKAAEPQASSTPAAETPLPEQKPTLPSVELTWYQVLNLAQADQEKVSEAVSKMVKDKINATVKLVPVLSSEYDQKMQVVIAGGEAFDICFTATWRNNFFQNVAKGAFLQVDDLIKNNAPNTYKSIPEKYWNAAKINGKLYSVLNYQIFCMTRGLWFKKDLVDKYAFDVNSVKSLQDIEPFLKAVKDGEKDIMPIEVRTNVPGIWNFSLEGFGIEAFSSKLPMGISYKGSDPTKVINDFATPEFKGYLDLVRDWFNKGYIRKDIISVKDTVPEKKAGKYACGLETYKPGIEAGNKLQYGYDFIFTTLNSPYAETNSVLATMNAISKTSKNPERAMMLLELMNTDKNIYNTMCHGIENDHYKTVSDNRIEPVADSKYLPNMDWAYGNQFNSYLLPGQPDSVWTDTIKMNEAAAPSPLLGFVPSNDPVKAEVANLTSASDEFLVGLTTGALDPKEYLPKFLDKLDKAGLQKVLDEYNNQVAAWKKANGK